MNGVDDGVGSEKGEEAISTKKRKGFHADVRTIA